MQMLIIEGFFKSKGPNLQMWTTDDKLSLIFPSSLHYFNENEKLVRKLLLFSHSVMSNSLEPHEL